MTPLDEAREQALDESMYTHLDIERIADGEQDAAEAAVVSVILTQAGRTLIARTYLPVDGPPSVVVSTFDDAGQPTEPILFALDTTVQVS